MCRPSGFHRTACEIHQFRILVLGLLLSWQVMIEASHSSRSKNWILLQNRVPFSMFKSAHLVV
jgi:hypothetical protein